MNRKAVDLQFSMLYSVCNHVVLYCFKPAGTRIQRDDLSTPLYILGVYGSTLNLLEPNTEGRLTYSSIFQEYIYGSTLNLLAPKTTYLLLYILGVYRSTLNLLAPGYRKTTYLLLFILGVYGSILNLILVPGYRKK